MGSGHSGRYVSGVLVLVAVLVSSGNTDMLPGLWRGGPAVVRLWRDGRNS